MALLLLSVSLASAACPSSPDAVHAAVETTVAAWTAWDWPVFDATVAGLGASVACVDAVLTPTQAGEVHLAFALAGARRKDLPATTQAFRALLAVDPAWLLPETLGVPGSFLAAAWVDAHGAVPARIERLGRGAWYVDGVRARALPLDRPTVLQLDAEPLATWLLAGGVLPDEVAARRPRRGLAWGLAGTAAVLSAGAFTAAGLAYAAYPEEPLHPERLEAVNHAGVIGGAALGVGALGLATVAVFGEW